MAITNYIQASAIAKPGVCTSSTRPASPYEGQVIYETDTDLVYVWGGAAWQQISGGTAVGNSGLVYVTSQTVGSAVASVTVSSAFNSTYDNYKITYSGGNHSADASIAIQFGASVTGYYGTLIYSTTATASVLVAVRNNTAQLNWVGGGKAGNASHVCIDVMHPNLAMHTKVIGGTYQSGDAFGTLQGAHNVATAYTSFVLTPDVGTISGGTITVYGYRKA